ncbi:MAG: hypothetical protein MUE97_08145, partial [Phycisphaerales bacterium]|nr:hypothetical protein [Phycisphaerales bacterium]
SIDPAHLAPRALLLTGLLRAFACDLFIHGTGGGATDSDRGYDRVTEDWFADWLSLPLAPATSATATLLPDLGHAPTVTEAQVRTARTRPHHAKHHPALLGNPEAQAIKDRFVAQIAATTDRPQRRTLYRQMHEALARAVAPEALSLLRTEADALAQRFELEAPLRDRTLPWPLHTRADLLALSREIAAALDGASS